MIATEILEKELADKTAEIVKLTAIVATLEAADTAQKSTIEKLEAELKTSNDLVTELHKALSATEAAEPQSDLIITHEKKKYRVAIPSFHFGGVEYKASDLKDNKELVAKVLARRGSVLIPV